MRAFRTLIVLSLLLCLIPPLSLLGAGLLARWAECELDLPPVTAIPCTVLGGDYGDMLFALAKFGWYAVETIPVFVALLVGWIIVEIVGRIGRPTKPRARTTLKTNPASRKLRQPSVPAASRNRVRGS